jgi:hypothetical protein
VEERRIFNIKVGERAFYVRVEERGFLYTVGQVEEGFFRSGKGCSSSQSGGAG